MNPITKIGKKAPLLQLSGWVKGSPTNLDQLVGKVVLIEVFQVNCPGCFLYSLPQAIDLHERYSNKGLSVLGMATAFEDFDKNNLDNLKLLIEQNLVIGETLRVLEQEMRLIDGRLGYSLPFPVAMDKVIKKAKEISDDEIAELIDQHVIGFNDKPAQEQQQIHQQACAYLQAGLYSAETFNLYNLRGTPSHIIVDKKGILFACEFGHFSGLEGLINSLLQAEQLT